MNQFCDIFRKFAAKYRFLNLFQDIFWTKFSLNFFYIGV